jgi:1,2-diacylglycerol 3-alpha-glucosyltransferase
MSLPELLPRILMVSDVYFPRVNGVSTSIQTFRRDLASLGCESRLIAPAYPVERADEPGILRVRSRYLPLDPEDRILRRGDFRRVAAAFEGQVDVVHVQTPFLAHYLGAGLARRLRVPLVVSYHTYFEHYFHHYLPLVPAAWLKWLARTVTRSQLQGVDCVIAPSPQMAEALAAYGVTAPIEVLPTGLDMELFRGGDGPRFRSAHGIPADRPVMLTVGRVAFEKNLEFLIDVLEHVQREIPDVLLVIAGEGPALESLRRDVARRGLAGHVLFVGYLDRATGLLDCYRGADVFVFASRTETQGLVLLESMAVGTPVVSTAVMGTRAVLDRAPGAIVVGEAVPEFSGAVAELLRDPDRRRVLGSAAANDVALRWSGPEMARRLLYLYRRLVATEPRRAGQSHAPGLPGT